MTPSNSNTSWLKETHVYKRAKWVRNHLRSLLESPEGRRHGLVGDAKLWEVKRAFQIAFLKQVGLQPPHKLFDIGCGTLRGGVPIIEYLDSGNYYGADVRALALAEAMKELTETQLDAKAPTVVLSSDLGHLELGTNFNYIWAYSVVFHMTDAVLDGALNFVGRQLAPGGSFYANANIGSEQPPGWKWLEFPVLWRSLEKYAAMAGTHRLRVEDIGSLSSFGHHSGNQSQDEQRMLKFSRLD